MTVLNSTNLYHCSLLYFTLLHSAISLVNSTLFYCAPPWLHLTLFDSTTLNPGSTWIYFTLLYPPMTFLTYLHLLNSTVPLIHSTLFYFTLPFLYPGSTIPSLPWLFFLLYLTLLNSTMALLDSSLLCYTVHSPYVTVLYSTKPYHGSSWLN